MVGDVWTDPMKGLGIVLNIANKNTFGGLPPKLIRKLPRFILLGWHYRTLHVWLISLEYHLCPWPKLKCVALLSPVRCLTKLLLDDCTGDSHLDTLDCHSSCWIFKGPTIAPLLSYFYEIFQDLRLGPGTMVPYQPWKGLEWIWMDMSLSENARYWLTKLQNLKGKNICLTI